MLTMIGATLLAVGITFYYILQKHHPIFVFLYAGLVLLVVGHYLTGAPIPHTPPAHNFGQLLLNAFAFIAFTFKKQLSGVGLIIMSVAGFAAYMKHIHASAKLAYLSNRPLSKISNKYLVLSGTFVVGMGLKIVISSYTGLLLLLCACIYPVLLALKIRPISAVCVLSLIALDYGPKDGNTINMADMVAQKDNIVGLFLRYQVWIVLSYTATIALLIPFYFAWVDRRDRLKNLLCDQAEQLEIANPPCPGFYILFPWFPVVLLFGGYFMGVKLDVVSANFISIAAVFGVEFIRHKDAKRLGEGMVAILQAMGDIFVSVVSIIIAASVFATGLKSLGGIMLLTQSLGSLQGQEGLWVVGLVMALLAFMVYGFSMVMGSGIAAFNAFGRLAPEIATKMGIEPINLVLPLEIASCLGRASSPIAGGILALAGFAKAAPIEIIKRTYPLLLVGMGVNLAVGMGLVVLG
ncbi:C4-dicarboxylate anaerobic carrier, putative [Helicobacter heilmannii]|uniref:C4-dicarboxylate transporter DcuC n=1 Tax=Helicobacter heilmannii TaxID=35817 RepID=UPI0006A1496F|nr:C4-dicarboxylate transporter DcuC [Helicobacter heilmannii]CRF48324.1 C4-dicarboxylate anaerobic carrier, putative [Helicobacter heilmannii]